MGEPRSDRRRFLFGSYTFAPGDGELRDSGHAVPLQRQPALALEYLLDHAGEVVTRDELIQHIWCGHHVKFDQSLNYCIRQIRRALAERAESPVYLETIPRKGYRWIAPVARAPDFPAARLLAPAAPPISTTVRRRWPAVAVSAGLTLLLVARLAGPVDPANVQHAAVPRSNQLGDALHALHVLSHALLEPGRDLDAASAVRTLWTIAARQFGLIPS
jgi:DNA-binding winged helix-turn-helix (wHTH) protein